MLSFNIHAITPIFSGDHPKKRIIEILDKADNFDIIFFQENWIFKNSKLKNSLHHHNIFSSNISKYPTLIKSMINPNGSGLSLAVEDNLIVIDNSEDYFQSCSGVFVKGNDCLASKGFQHIQIQVKGERLDLYNTHLDAGVAEGDIKSRKLQLEQLANYIELNSDGYPIILAGDININLHDKDEISNLNWFLDKLELNMIDFLKDEPGLEQMLDYILFRDSNILDIQVKDKKIDHTFDGLSDHPAIISTLIIEKNLKTTSE